MPLYDLNYSLSILKHGETPSKLPITSTNYSGGAVLQQSPRNAALQTAQCAQGSV